MPSPEADQVFKLNEELFHSWTSNPNATIDDLRRIFEEFLAGIATPDGTTFKEVDCGGVPGIWVTAPGASADHAVMHFHSGGYVLGSAHGYRSFGGYLSAATNARVLLVDYRLAPEHPFPAAMEDARAAHTWLINQGIAPSNIVISGDSGGGGLAMVLLQELRDRGGDQPAAGVMISPWADFTLTGESMTTNAANDPLAPGPGLLEMLIPMIISEDVDRKDRRVSPIFGDWRGVPPLLMLAGSIETLRDDGKRAVEAASAAGVDATFIEGEGMVHIWPIFADRLPEARKALEQIGAFVKRHLGAGVSG